MEKEIKPIPDYIREDAAWGRTKTRELIKSGVLKTIRVGKRDYIVMASHRHLVELGAPTLLRRHEAEQQRPNPKIIA